LEINTSMRLFELTEKFGDKSELQLELDDFADQVKARNGLKQFWVFDSGNGVIELSMILVDKDKQKQGAGSGAMRDLCEYADDRGLIIKLIPGVKDTGHGTSSRSRLIKFYKRFGFVENKGRNMDYAIGAGRMIRYPQ
jgi:GNAT superfamily N-acetyltransferase